MQDLLGRLSELVAQHVLGTDAWDVRVVLTRRETEGDKAAGVQANGPAQIHHKRPVRLKEELVVIDLWLMHLPPPWVGWIDVEIGRGAPA